MESISSVIERAGEIVGSQAELARLCDVQRAAVSNWKLIGSVPIRHCKTVERHTGISCRELRPDDWHKYWPAPEAKVA